MVFISVNHLPNVRDLCVEQKMIATVSAGVKPEFSLGAKIGIYRHFDKHSFAYIQVKYSTFLHVNLPLISPSDRSHIIPKGTEVWEFLLGNHF